MLSGLALHGDGRKALQVFDAMARESHAPDAAAYRTEAVDRGLAQFPGFSAVEVRGELHRFVS